MKDNSFTEQKQNEALACHKSLLIQDKGTWTCVSEVELKEDSQDDFSTDASVSGAQEYSKQEKQFKVQQYLIEKTAIYYAKMCMHDLRLAT